MSQFAPLLTVPGGRGVTKLGCAAPLRRAKTRSNYASGHVPGVFANVSPDVRRAMAGHSSDAVHRKYVHLDTSAQKAAVSNLPAV